MKKIKCLLIFFSVSLIWINIFTQNNISPEWLINSLGEDWDVVSSQIIDQNDNLYLAGNFTSSILLGENSDKLSGKNSSWITKITNEGEVDWFKQISSSQNCHINTISIDPNESVYFSGNFKGEMTLGGELLISYKEQNSFIGKLDKAGNIIWGKQISGKFQNKNIFLSNDSENNLLFTGSFSGELKLNDKLYKSENSADIVIAKFNNNGDLQKILRIGGIANDYVNDIAVDRNNEIIITGSFEKELIIGNNTYISKGKKDAFLLRIDNELQLINMKQIGGFYDDYGKSISIDQNNNPLLSGSFTHHIKLNEDHFLESNGKLDVFLLKFDNTGRIIWNQSFGGPANDYSYSMAVNKKSNVYLVGNYRGQINKDDHHIKSSEFSNDIFLAKVSAEGTCRYMESIGNNDHDFARNISIAPDNYIYLSGNYSNLLKVFENESKPSDSEEFFLTKLYDCDESKKIELPGDTTLCAEKYIITVENDFDQYFWNGKAGSYEFQIDSTGLYTIEVIDSHHCFSRDTIFVQLNTPPEVELGDTITVQQGEIVSLNAPFGMKEYLWSDNSTFYFLDVNTEKMAPGYYFYWIEVSDDNECISTSEVIIEVVDSEMILNAGLNKNNGQGLIVNVSPNPIKDIMTIYIENIDLNSEVEAYLYTIKGVRVLTHKSQCATKNEELNLQVGSFKTGSYTLKIINGNRVVNKSIVIAN